MHVSSWTGKWIQHTKSTRMAFAPIESRQSGLLLRTKEMVCDDSFAIEAEPISTQGSALEALGFMWRFARADLTTAREVGTLE
jgi:hypothetical protein